MKNLKIYLTNICPMDILCLKKMKTWVDHNFLCGFYNDEKIMIKAPDRILI